ncbi:MAG TPA: hypothetical protein VJT82_06800 [Pyrinomonadaceae bacterium]|nr:hypothetical protein [Pyrinomonadaceae bacterium]
MRRNVLQFALLALALAALPVVSVAQGDASNTRTRRVSPPAQTNAPGTTTTTGAQSNADENFELNITERRITERDFFASTSVGAGEESAHGLSLRVGVAVGASEIDVLLRNVVGRVRFRASLDALRRVLDARRTATPTQQSVP